MSTVPTISAAWMNTVPQFTGRERENEKWYISFAIYISYFTEECPQLPLQKFLIIFPTPFAITHYTDIIMRFPWTFPFLSLFKDESPSSSLICNHSSDADQFGIQGSGIMLETKNGQDKFLHNFLIHLDNLEDCGIAKEASQAI